MIGSSSTRTSPPSPRKAPSTGGRGQTLVEDLAYGAWDHPHEGPILSGWAAHYQHVFIALHPFFREDADERITDVIRWGELASKLGGPTFADFALAVTLASNGMDGSGRGDAERDLIGRLMRHVGAELLEYPDDGYFPDALRPQVHRILSKLGATTVIARDQHRGNQTELSLEALVSDAPFPGRPGAVAHPDRSFIITSFPMDVYHSVVGLTEKAHQALGGELGLEGFWAGPETTDSWVNERGTYTYPSRQMSSE